MIGRLIGCKWDVNEGGGLFVTAYVKTFGGKRCDVPMGVARTNDELLALINEANERFPNPAKHEMGGRT